MVVEVVNDSVVVVVVVVVVGMLFIAVKLIVKLIADSEMVI